MPPQHNGGGGGSGRAGYRVASSANHGWNAAVYTASVQKASYAHKAQVKRLIKVVPKIGKIVMDELGITAGLDCFFKGDLGACGETALNVMMSAVGGLAGKIAAKYGAPWRWKKAYALGRTLAKLGGQAIDAVGDVIATSKSLRALKKTCNSFTAATPVLMADGSKKPIKNVEVGDEVAAADPATGEAGSRVVTDLIRHSGPHTMVDVQLADATVIEATDEHPFWVESRGQWIDAIDIWPGDVLKTAVGTRVQVTAIKVHREDLRAYNLTVDDLHTYHVGEDEVLVHNDSCGIRPPSLSPIGAGRSGAFNQAKRDAGVPRSASPSRTLPNVDKRGRVQPGRRYEFDLPACGGGRKTVVIREDAGGREFPDDPLQNRGPHFNTENGDHYDY